MKDSTEVKQNWEAIKRQEGKEPGPDGLPSLPAAKDDLVALPCSHYVMVGHDVPVDIVYETAAARTGRDNNVHHRWV